MTLLTHQTDLIDRELLIMHYLTKWLTRRRLQFFRIGAVLSLCLQLGSERSLGATTTLSIPGAITIHILPPEAGLAGAGWILDEGPEFGSGVSVTNVVPGEHTIRFTDLSAWLEPEATTAFVVGGKETSLTVTYRPVPNFYFQAIPEQRPRVDKGMEFFVHTEDAEDPQSPGPGVTLQMTAVPQPVGPILYDPASGRITYKPSSEDRLPFTVQLATPAQLIGSFEVTPINGLASEDTVIDYDRPLPDAGSRDYMEVSEVPHAVEEFNGATRTNFTVSISGATLIFAQNDSANLYRQFNGRENLHDLNLYADTVIIRAALNLPQTDVSIHARQLRFEGDGRLDTTPRPRTLRPDGATIDDGLLAGHDGYPGYAGGSMEVWVERFYSDAPTGPRFILNGGQGGPAGEGRDGQPAVQVSDDLTKLKDYIIRAGNTVCGTTKEGKIVTYREEQVNGQFISSCGRKEPVRGEGAVPSGHPGSGGNGGALRSTLDLSAYTQTDGASAGNRGNDYHGGTLTGVEFIRRIENDVFKNGEDVLRITDSVFDTVPGPDAAAPSGLPGAAGSVQLVPHPEFWLHSFGVRSLVHFAKDAYLNGRIAETRQILSEYEQALLAYPTTALPEDELTDEEFAEKEGLDQLLTEVQNLLHRIDSNLDYFGNPAGWVPMLSFEANLTAFQNEINQSIPILYLAYWLNNAATNLQNSLAATQKARDTLEDERQRLELNFNEAQSAIPRLKSDAILIAYQIGTNRTEIDRKLKELEERARNTVIERHKVPFWKKACGALSVVADLIPYGQPVVGRIGEGLKLLTQLDFNDPVESAKRIAPQVSGVMTNVDISLCFNTNSAAAFNAAGPSRRQKLDQLVRCGKFLSSEYKEIAAVFKDAQVDNDEVKAELEKIKASDDDLKAIAVSIDALNAKKAAFAQELATALQSVGSFGSSLSANLIATQELEDRIGANLTALDHGALIHIKEMELRARDRLLRYQYYTAKAFQYRLLRPFNGNFQLNTLLDRFQAIVAGTNSHILTQQEFDNLKQLYLADLANTSDLALSTLNANAPEHAQPTTFSLTAEELRELNSTNREVTIDLAQHHLFPSFHEDIRIVNLRVTGTAVHPVGGSLGENATLFLDINHLGESRLTRGGKNYRFRHYQSRTVSPIAWNAVIDVVRHTTNNSTLSPASDSLLRVLLHQPSDANMLLFSRPAADAQFLIRREALTDNGTDLALDNLTLQVEYEFAQQSLAQRTLEVTVANDLRPVVVVSQRDIAGRQDGQGSFTRAFATSSPVTLQAPSTYGQYVFDQWLVDGAPQSSHFPVFALILANNTRVEARYRLVPGTLRLTPVSSSDRQIGFSFPSQPGVNYVIEETTRLDNPTWTAVESRVGDGATILFGRPFGTTSTLFRVRQSP